MGRVNISYDKAVKLGLTKECTECHKVKSVSEFHREIGSKYGVASKCKECRANYNKQRYQNNKEEIINRQKQYYQNNKEEIINRQKQYQKQYYQNNKEEIANYHKEYHKEYYQNNREEIINQHKQYRQEHKQKISNYNKQYLQTQQGKENARKRTQKRRALKKDSFYQTFSQQDLEFCLNYFNHRCPYTGKPLTDSEIHLDHIVALSDKNGVGATAPWNLIVCDASTNKSKSNKPVLEFINSLPNSEEVYSSIRNYIVLQAKKYIDHVPKDDITLKIFNITFDELKEVV